MWVTVLKHLAGADHVDSYPWYLDKEEIKKERVKNIAGGSDKDNHIQFNEKTRTTNVDEKIIDVVVGVH